MRETLLEVGPARSICQGPSEDFGRERMGKLGAGLFFVFVLLSDCTMTETGEIGDPDIYSKALWEDHFSQHVCCCSTLFLLWV